METRATSLCRSGHVAPGDGDASDLAVSLRSSRSERRMEICKISTPPNLFFYLSTSELSRTHRERGLKVGAHSQKKHN
ncbi:hypothetical protein YC2023_082421 [Brassica napus]